MDDKQSDSLYEFSRSPQPFFAAAWRGRFNIPRQNLNINVAAHVSNKACLEVASIIPESLCLEIIHRLDVWPASYRSSPPNEHSVALFFFPEGRDEEIFSSLLNYALCGDYALKAVIGKSELLIFTSLQLPVKLHRFQGKLYMWGVFNQRVTAYQQSEHQLHIQTPIVRLSLSANSCGQRSFDGNESPIISSNNQSPLSQTNKSDGRGRRLDDAWQHAKPLDPLRQKAECKYCGFISSHGGISRLKAHLGGGHPIIRLPGCVEVSSEVKNVMSDWFQEWVKKTKAIWTKEIRDGTASRDEKGRPHDDAWEDEKTDFKCFSFDFSRGEISHRKVSGGGDRNSDMEALPKVSPQTKGAMSVKVKKSKGYVSPESKGIMSEFEKSQASVEKSDKRGRPLDNAWQHAKPLDEARQKTRCNYCGFVSTYGGISRLKAHLGGGCAEMQLQCCTQVPIEVKIVMEQWFGEWVKYSTATWTRKSNGKPSETHDRTQSAISSKRRRLLEDVWEHAIALDETKQATKCKYCGFISKIGGISRIRAHFIGGDLAMQLEGCPYVPPEVKSSMMIQGKKKYTKKSKAAKTESLGGVGQETASTKSEAHAFERRHHDLQETLDGVRNTCRKESLVHEKNVDLQKMQFEIQCRQNR